MGKFGEDKFGESKFGETADDFTATIESQTTIEADITSVQTSTTISPQTSINADFTSSNRVATVSPETTIDSDVTATSPAFDLGEEWRVIRDGDTIEPDLFDVEVVSTANPFGTYAVAKIDDTEGEKFDQYTRGTRVDFEYSTDIGLTWTERFSGFVVEARELEDQGADTLEVEAYSFDQFLRRDTVTNDQSGNTILEALEDIVTIDTPVTWDASNVTVQDNQTLTQSLRGERVENAIQMLRAKSADEDFGVNSDIEFFFEPQETTSAPRDITDSDWFNYDLPEEGKRTINQVTVYFDDGDRSVTVDDGGDKLDLQDSLGTDDPITFAEEVTREEITNIDDARDVGEKILSDRETTLTGTVTTYGLLDASTGDVINIEIIDRGIDGDFAIAELKYLWGRGETVITVVEKRGDQDDLLVGISDTLKRTEMRPANRDATENRITNTTIRGLITVSGDVDGTSYTTWRFTNAGRNKIRDGWADNGNLDIATIAVGNDPTTPTRTDDSLGNQLASDSVTQTLPDSKTARYTASISESDVREVGLFTNDGTIIARAVVPETSFSSPVDVTLDLTVANDASVSRGVLTNDGQTTTRDIIADNSPSLPTQYAYGTGTTSPTEPDTSLESQVHKVSIDEILVQSADSQEDWENIVSINDDVPVKVENGELQATQTCFTEDIGETGNVTTADSDFSDGLAAALGSVGQFRTVSFTPEHTIAADQFELAYRWGSTDSSSSAEIQISVNGEVLGSQTLLTGADSVVWHDAAIANQSWLSAPTSPLNAGEQATVRFEVISEEGGNWELDVAAPYDTGARFSFGPFSYTFDNDNGGNDGYLDGPELYADEIAFALSEADTRRTLQNATCTQVWNNTDNNQYIELSNDGGSTWITTNNSQTATANFASPETGVQARVGLSRFGSRTTATPQTGFNGQSIDSHTLDADVDAVNASGLASVDVRAIVSPGTISASTNLREAGQLDSSDNLLTRTTGLDVDVTANMRIESSENTSWNNA